MDARRVVIGLEVGELSFEVTAVPKQNMVEKLAPSSANQPLHKGMREWNVRHCFDLIDIQYPQICLPTMKFEQGVMIGTDVSRCALTADGLVEHPAKRYPIHSANMNTKTDDPSGELIHDDEDPVRPQDDGFTPKQIGAPQAVLRVTDER